MSIYPFYTEINSSTRKTVEGVGCRAKEGTMTTSIHQRECGAITTPYKINQYSEDIDGVLYLTTEILYKNPETERYEVIHQHFTKY